MLKINTMRLFTALFALVFVGAGCSSSCQGKSDSKGQAISSDAAALVNGKNISVKKLDDLYKRSVEKFAKTGRPVSDELSRKMRGSILRKMIDDEIIRQRAESLGIVVDRFDRVEALEQYKQHLGGPKAYEAFLSQQELSEDQILDTILADSIRAKIVEKTAGKIEISDKEIEQHYEANKSLYSLPEMVHVRHILLKVAKEDPQEKIALVLKKAQIIIEESNDPRNSFESLVQKYSEGPNIDKGGDLGFFPRGRMVKEFEEAAFNAPLKQAVGPIKTEYGYHILYVEEKSAPHTAPLSEVRPRIVELLKHNNQSRKTEEILFSLRKSADIKINDYSMTQEEFLALSKQQQLAAKQEAKK